MRLLVAFLSAIVGIALLFGGYRIARFIIPFAGFLAGLSVGGAIISDMQSTPFLGTLLGVTVGLLFGLFLAVIAYLYYYVAIIILAAALGYSLGAGFLSLLGINATIMTATAGVVVGAVIGLLAIVTNAPKLLLIGLTSIYGTLSIIGGVLLLFGKISIETFSYAAVEQSISNSVLWAIIGIALVVVGISVQMVLNSQYELEAWSVANAGGDSPAPKAKATKEEE